MSKHRTRIGCSSALLLALLCISLKVPAAVVEKTMRVAGVDVQYKIVLPEGFEAAKSYPAIIVLGGGPQTMATVDRTLESNFRAEAQRRGYLVIAPAAPNGQLFFEGGERIFPEFLRAIRGSYQIEGDKFHIAGPSNGGIAALHIAALYPDDFLSVTAFPGYLWQPTQKKLRALLNHCVYLYVGEHDEYRWHAEMKREAEFLRAAGAVAHYSVEQGQPHRLDTLAGARAARLFEGFEAAKRGCTLTR